MTEHLKGMLAAVHSPFHSDGSLNLNCVERQAAHLVRQGVVGAFVCGTTGESMSLTVPERKQLAERWLEVANKSLRVIVHVGHNCLADACELALHAQRLGIDGIAAVAPSFLRPARVEDLVEFCRLIAETAPGIPFYYYHIPKLTNVDFLVADFLAHAADRIPSLGGIKYTHNDLVDFGNCLASHDGRWDMIYGSEQMLLSALVLGAQAAIGTTFNYIGRHVGQVFAAWNQGDLPAARRALQRVRCAVPLIHSTNALPASKAVMTILGIDCGPVRLPLRSLTIAEVQELRTRLDESGLLREMMLGGP